MAENDPVLEQRVEALEQFSQTRVVEQVGELTERVSGLESARAAENPHLASKSDIVRLEERLDAFSEQFSKDLTAQSEQFNTQLAAHSEQFSKDLKAQGDRFDTQLTAQSEQFSKDFKAQSDRFDTQLTAQSEQIYKDLKAQSDRFDTQLNSLSEQFNTQLTAQSKQFDSKQDAQTEQLRREWEQRINKLISWMIVAIIAFSGLVISAAAFIINNLPS